MKKLTTEEFIKRANEIHMGKYDYSKVKYIDANTKVCIICLEHGEFWQTPRAHLNGSGCNKCAHIRVNTTNTKTTEEFVSEAKLIHGDKYDYSKVIYNGCYEPICIICPIHGEFWQSPDNHLHNHGCSKCRDEVNQKTKSITTEEFIKRAKEIHGDKYDYSKVIYVNCDREVNIICPIHGGFSQTPYNHLHSSGCPYCKNWKLEEEITKFLEENDIKFIRQKRFKWLGRQSLDVYIPSYNIAIECQGIQHFKPINYFGGIKGFENLKRLDKQKNKLCKDNGVKLLYYSNLQIGDNIITNKEKLLKEIKRGIT